MGLVGFLLCPPPVNFPLECRPTKTKTPSGCSCQRGPQLCRWPQASQAEAHVSREGGRANNFRHAAARTQQKPELPQQSTPLGKRHPLKSAKVPHNSPEHGRVISPACFGIENHLAIPRLHLAPPTLLSLCSPHLLTGQELGFRVCFLLEKGR